MNRSAHMLRLNLSACIQKLEAHLALTKDKKLRKRVRNVIRLKQEKMDRIHQ